MFEGLIIVATIAGPILAVQAQKWIERATERRRNRLQVFSAIMANRATRMSDEYVRALNLIELVFLPQGWSKSRDQAVLDAWRSLHGDLSHPPAQNDQAANVAWNLRIDDRLIDLLAAMSRSLGYAFKQEELRRGTYRPQGIVEREQAQLDILHGLRQILGGKASLPMDVTHFPADSEVVNAQAALLRLAAAAYDRETGALKVQRVTSAT